jgi:predicted transcriptional regulator
MDAQLQIRLPKALKERCEAIAEREMISVADVVRQALKAQVETDEAKQQPSTSEVRS